MGRFDSIGGEAFWITSQFDPIPREVARTMSRSGSMPGESARVVIWFLVNSAESILVKLEPWAESI